MTLKYPRPLEAGDLVALVSPSGPVPRPEVVDQCREALEALGYRVWVGPSASKRIDYLAGTDQERASDLNHAFGTKEIRGIFCTRGGYGSGRLLGMLDYKAMADDPKIFAGFSDLTNVHSALHVKSRVATLHSPTIATALVYEKGRITDKAHRVLMHQLGTTDPVGSVQTAMGWHDAQVLRRGHARGVLTGGNLACFAGLVGTPYLPPPEGKILFIEDVGEEPYRLDRMIIQLEQNGYLGKIEGLILGQFTDAEPTDPKREKVDVVLPRILEHLNIPVVMNFPAGHVPHNASLPLGCEAELDAENGDVILTEPLCR